MVLKLFEDTAERIGLERVKTVGERFDPAVHEAIQQQETDEHAARHDHRRDRRPATASASACCAPRWSWSRASPSEAQAETRAAAEDQRPSRRRPT